MYFKTITTPLEVAAPLAGVQVMVADNVSA